MCKLPSVRSIDLFAMNCSSVIFQVGKNFIQLGMHWRIGLYDSNTLSIAYKSNGKDGTPLAHRTAFKMFANTGKCATCGRRRRNGCGTDHSVWKTTPERIFEAEGVEFGNGYVQIGDWRLGEVNSKHFSISNKNGNTNVIWTGNDAKTHWGKRTDYNLWKTKSTAGPVEVSQHAMHYTA